MQSYLILYTQMLTRHSQIKIKQRFTLFKVSLKTFRFGVEENRLRNSEIFFDGVFLLIIFTIYS